MSRWYLLGLCAALLALLHGATAVQFDLGADKPNYCLSVDLWNGLRLKGTYTVPDMEDSWDTTIYVRLIAVFCGC